MGPLIKKVRLLWYKLHRSQKRTSYAFFIPFCGSPFETGFPRFFIYLNMLGCT